MNSKKGSHNNSQHNPSKLPRNKQPCLNLPYPRNNRFGKSIRYDRSKSFVFIPSSVLRPFLSCASLSDQEDDIPMRLNRLHGANESTMSALAPTTRMEFIKVCNMYRRTALRSTQAALERKEAGKELEKRAREKRKRQKAIKAKKKDDSKSKKKDTSLFRSRDEYEEDTWEQDTEQRLEEPNSLKNIKRKTSEVALSIGELIIRYDTDKMTNTRLDSDIEKQKMAGSFKIETNYNIDVVRAMFEKPSLRASRRFRKEKRCNNLPELITFDYGQPRLGIKSPSREMGSESKIHVKALQDGCNEISSKQNDAVCTSPAKEGQGFCDEGFQNATEISIMSSNTSGGDGCSNAPEYVDLRGSTAKQSATEDLLLRYGNILNSNSAYDEQEQSLALLDALSCCIGNENSDVVSLKKLLN